MQRTGLTYRYQTADYIVGKSQFADLFFEMRAKSIGLPDDFYTIANPVGAIIEELVANSGIGNPGGFINEAIAELLEVPHWNEEGEQATEGPILSCKWRLTWS